MNSAFVQLLLKELRLQRGNLIFAVCAFVLIFVGLWLIRLNPGIFLGYSTEDVQSTVMFLMGIPVLIVILPTMFGSTAAAAEKPLEVLAWQSALPVARWKVILAKCLVAAASVVIVAGVFPYVLEVALEESGFLQQLTRGFWIGLHGLLFCAIGFFAGSHSKDDYQGLMVAVVPTVVVLVSLMFFDVVGKVMPAGLPFELTRPWAVVVRLLAMMALLVVLAVPMHIRVPVRRWWPMAGRLAVVFVAGLVLTAWNLHVEGTVLKELPREGETAGMVTTDAAGHKVVEPVVIGQVKETRTGWKRGKIRDYDNSGVDLQSGKRVSLLRVELAHVVSREFRAVGVVLAKSDGTLTEFASVLAGGVAGFSRNQNWMFFESDDLSVLAGPLGMSIPLFILPDTLEGFLLRAFDIDYSRNVYEWHLPVNHPGASPTDIALDGLGSLRGRIWKDGGKHVPEGWRTAPGFTRNNSFIYNVDMQKRGETTMTAVLTPGPVRGEFELVGFVHGYAADVSEDGVWVRDTPSTYRKTLPWDEARMLPPIGFQLFLGLPWNVTEVTTTTLANGQKLVSRGLISIPVVETEEGPATLETYTLFESQPGESPGELRALEAGVLIKNLPNGTTTPLTLLTAAEGTEAELRDLASIYRSVEWNQSFQTLRVDLGRHFIILNFSNYRNSTPEEILADAVRVKYRGHNHQLLAPNRLLSVDNYKFYLAEW